MISRATPKRVRVYLIRTDSGTIRRIETTREDARAWCIWGYTFEPGYFIPDPPRRAKRKEVKRGK